MKSWISTREAAALAGTSPTTMRRRLEVLERVEPRLRRHFAPHGHAVRKWWVNAHVFARLFGLSLGRDLEKIELDVNGLKKGLRDVERRTRQLENRRSP